MTVGTALLAGCIARLLACLVVHTTELVPVASHIQALASLRCAGKTAAMLLAVMPGPLCRLMAYVVCCAVL
jgi:hypothetical protein